MQELGRIEFFMHDSEHSYECMQFEMALAEEHLAPAPRSWSTMPTGVARSTTSFAHAGCLPGTLTAGRT